MEANTALQLRVADAGIDIVEAPTRPGEPAFVAADELDRLSTLMIPDAIALHPTELAHAEAESLFVEGFRGAIGRSLLAKNITAARAHLLYFGALLDYEVERLARGCTNERRVRLLSDLADKQHRRLVASAELLLRLDVPNAPAISVRADNAAFVVASDVRTQAG
jgi:hypothetical protein